MVVRLADTSTSDDVEQALKCLGEGQEVRVDSNTDLSLVHLLAWYGLKTPPLACIRKSEMSAKNSSGDTPLHLAIQQGNFDVAEALVDAGADVCASNNRGNTPLHAAAWRGNEALVFKLLVNGADVNARDSSGNTPLHLAIQPQNLDVAEALIDAGADVCASNNSGNTLLHAAAWYGNEALVLKLLINGADVNARDSSGDTPLHIAIRQRHLGVAYIMLYKGADVCAANTYGKTPLYSAVWHGNETLVGDLVRLGADVAARDRYGQTPADLAVVKRFDNISNILSGKEVSAKGGTVVEPGSLHAAVKANNVAKVLDLLQQGADIDGDDNPEMNTPLNVAIQHRRLALVYVLLVKGAQINIANALGHVPMHLAAINYSKAVLGDLLAGQQINIRDNYGNHALHLAVTHHQLSAVHELLIRGVDVNGVNYDGHSALSLAVQQGYADIVEKILQFTERLNLDDHEGNSLLHGAVRNQSLPVITVLLKYRPLTAFKEYSRGGFTALHYAVRSKCNRFIIKALLDAGANINAVTATCRFTALHLAVMFGHIEALELLLLRPKLAINARSSQGTALSMAAVLNNAQMVTEILKHNPNVNCFDHFNQTPLHVVLTRGDSNAMAGMLLSKGALCHVMGSNFSVLRWAQQYNREDFLLVWAFIDTVRPTIIPQDAGDVALKYKQKLTCLMNGDIGNQAIFDVFADYIRCGCNVRSMISGARKDLVKLVGCKAYTNENALVQALVNIFAEAILCSHQEGKNRELLWAFISIQSGRVLPWDILERLPSYVESGVVSQALFPNVDVALDVSEQGSETLPNSEISSSALFVLMDLHLDRNAALDV